MSELKDLPWSEYRSLGDDYPTIDDDGIEKLAQVISNSHGVEQTQNELYSAARIRTPHNPKREMQTESTPPQSILIPVKVDEAVQLNSFKTSLRMGIEEVAGFHPSSITLEGSVPHVNVICGGNSLFN